jgi:hypothetical protein
MVRALVVGLAAGTALGQCPVSESVFIGSPDPDFEGRFGIAVAIAGDLMVVGEREDDQFGSNTGAAHVFRLVEGEWVYEQKLTASDPQQLAEFGDAVGTDGESIIVGAPSWDAEGGVVPIAGRAYVFVHDGDSWVEQDVFTHEDFAIFDSFGDYVAIEGGRAVVGAPEHDSACEGAPPDIYQNCNSGAAYVFERDGEAWSQTAKLEASDKETRDLYGETVAVAGDVIAVGAWSENNTGGPCPPNCSVDGAGAVYMYRLVEGAWVEEKKLIAPDGGNQFGAFGLGLDFDGPTRMIVGSTGDDEMVPSGGAAFVYEYDADAQELWLLDGHLIPGDVMIGDFAGASVALEGNVALVGCDGDDENGLFNVGSAYVFVKHEGAWSQQAKFLPPTPEQFEAVGLSVGLSGGIAVIGAPGDNTGMVKAGAAHVLRGIADCNGNGELDLCEIQDGAPDKDGDGVLDECAGCAADVNGDGALNVLDFVAFQLAWQGQEPIGDCDGNGAFNVLDFVCYQLLFQACCP